LWIVELVRRERERERERGGDSPYMISSGSCGSESRIVELPRILHVLDRTRRSSGGQSRSRFKFWDPWTSFIVSRRPFNSPWQTENVQQPCKTSRTIPLLPLLPVHPLSLILQLVFASAGYIFHRAKPSPQFTPPLRAAIPNWRMHDSSEDDSDATPIAEAFGTPRSDSIITPLSSACRRATAPAWRK